MALSCIPTSVLSSANCTENPAGLGNFLYAVPVANKDYIQSIVPDDTKNQYTITPAGGASAALKGFRIDFKSQTGQYSSDDNGTGKGWSGTGTGRVELSEDQMAFTSRVLHNSDKYIYFLSTGKKVKVNDAMVDEYIVVGNENGEAEWSVKADSGTKRSDDHGQTWTVKCDYQLYPTTKWYGTIEQADAISASSKKPASSHA